MSNDVYCKKCILKKGHPFVNFNDDGLCGPCNGTGTDWKKHANNYKVALHDYKNYIKSEPNKLSSYDCMLMFSGGKDSTFMLDKTINEHKKRVLAWTYNLPTENKAALNNIEKICNLLEVEHIAFTAHYKYRKLIRNFFNNSNKSSADKYAYFGSDVSYMTCLVCTSYMVVSAYILAYQMKIPYILYCSDPIQIVQISTDIKHYIKMMSDTIGEKLLNEIFDGQIDKILNNNEDELPKIIYPYIGLTDYDAEKIVAELTEKGLYKQEVNPIATICSLFGLANYHSYKNFNCSIYSKYDARFVREGLVSRDEMIQLDKDFKNVILHIATKKNITEEEKESIKSLAMKISNIMANENISKMNTGAMKIGNKHNQSETTNLLVNIFLNTRKIADEFGIVVD